MDEDCKIKCMLELKEAEILNVTFIFHAVQLALEDEKLPPVILPYSTYIMYMKVSLNSFWDLPNISFSHING